MKKYVLDLKVVSVEALSDKHVLIKLTDEIISKSKFVF